LPAVVTVGPLLGSGRISTDALIRVHRRSGLG
jgi:hypothetical protein